LAGYRSVLSGRQPAGHSFSDWAQEREGIAALIKEWDASPELRIPHEQIAICVPTNQMAAEVGYTLGLHGIRPVEIRADGPHGEVHIGTMFRFKGLEYQRMIIGGVTDGLVPRDAVNRLRTSDPVRFRHEMQRARSLLFVAATRARDSVDIFWHGTPSPFLGSSLTEEG
ncbi:3'-5' exonuclease, partial [Streptomyces eurythermus]